MNGPFSSLTGDINKWNNELVSAQTISPTLHVFFSFLFFYESRSHNIKVLIHYFKTFFLNNILVFFIISMQAVSFRMIRFIFIFFQINPSHDRLEVFVRFMLHTGTKTVSAIGVTVAHFSRFMCVGMDQGFYGSCHF